MIGDLVSKKTEQLERELQSLKDEIGQLAVKRDISPEQGNVSVLVRQMIEERERTNKLLEGITTKIGKLEKEMDELYGSEAAPAEYDMIGNREIPLSGLDTKILNFIQSKGMICADDLVGFMKYRGRNAACARLNRLYRQGIIDRYQLGHKVFYKFDAGKATNTLIISPPQ